MGVSGDAKFIARLRRAAKIATQMDEWANEAAEVIAKEARDLIDEGGIPSPNHIVSNPGEAPNTDSGNLAAHTQAEKLPDQGKAAVISDATSEGGYSYSQGLEFGTSRMFERPFMRPATANKRKFVLTLARNAVNKSTR